MRKKTKILPAAIAVLVCAALVAGAIFLRGHISGGKKSDVLYTVREETFEDTIEISGNISAANEQKIQSPADCIIEKVHVKQGDLVKKGDLLVEFDKASQEYNLAQIDYNIMQKRMTGAAKELQLLQSQRKMAVKSLEDRNVYARFDGIVSSFDADSGDVVEMKDQLGVLQDRSYLKASVEVAETDAGRLKIGQKVSFNFPAYKESKVEGYVASYPAVGTITSRGATVVNAEIRIDDPPEQILTGFSFTAEIEISAPQTILLVETQAVKYDKGESFVEVRQDDGSFKRQAIQAELYGEQFVKILSGVKKGDELRQLNENARSGSFRRNRGPMGGPPPRR